MKKRNKSLYEYLLKKYGWIVEEVEQNNKLVIDFDGYRWAKCVLCGTIATVVNFENCGFEGNINQGKCRECVSKMEVKKWQKGLEITVQ